MMLLTHALELVIADTRENTDPELTINEAIKMVRETGEDAMYGTTGDLRTAYLEVLKADQSRIDYCLGL